MLTFCWLICLASIVLADDRYVAALYYPEWSFRESGHLPSDLPLDSITTLYYGFFKIKETTLDIYLPNKRDAAQAVIPFHAQELTNNTASAVRSIGLIGQMSQLKSLNNNLHILMAIGGAETAKVFARITDSKEDMVKFVEMATEFTEFYGFDGVDIDWEYPNAKHTDKMSQLVAMLRDRLDSLQTGCGQYQLTIAIPSDIEHLDKYDFDELSRYVDHYNLMGYDMGGIWTKRATFQSQLYDDPNALDSGSVNSTIHYLVDERGVDPRQIILGMPAYGRTFNTGKLYKRARRCAPLKGIKQHPDECLVDYNMLPPEGYHERFDEATGSAYAYNREGKGGIITYDNAESARMKAQYVKSLHLGGGVWWDSSGDTYSTNRSRSLLFSFVDELGGIGQLEDNHCIINENLYYGDFSNSTYDGRQPEAAKKKNSGSVATHRVNSSPGAFMVFMCILLMTM